MLKKSKKFKILFCSRESKKTIFWIFPNFLLIKWPKIREIGFLDSRDQNKILKTFHFFDFSYMTSISFINHHFRVPSALKTLKSSPEGQNLLGDPLIAHSDHRGPVSAQFCRLSCHF